MICRSASLGSELPALPLYQRYGNALHGLGIECGLTAAIVMPLLPLLVSAIPTLWACCLGVLSLLVHWPLQCRQVKPRFGDEACARQCESTCGCDTGVGAGEEVDPWSLASSGCLHAGLPTAESNGAIRSGGKYEQTCGRTTVRVLLVIAHPDDESM